MPRGRTRDTDAEQRILDATIELLSQRGAGKVRIDDIALAASVGKQTIYRWWPSRNAVVIDALLHLSTQETPLRDTGDLRADLRHHMRAVVRLFTSTTGPLIRELVAEGQGDAEVAEEFRRRFWAPRRDLTVQAMRRGIERGQVRADIDLEAVLDALYGPMWTRLLIGYAPVNHRLVDELLGVVWPGVAAS
jgi:AcrR family transcriptional regulator